MASSYVENMYTSKCQQLDGNMSVMSEALKGINTLVSHLAAARFGARCCWYIESTYILLALQVIAAAKHGFRASGFELNPWLVWYSRLKAWREGVHRSTSFHISDLWKVSHA